MMKATRFNPFDYIDNDDDIKDILNEAYNDSDSKTFVTAIGHLIDKKGVAEVSRLTGLNRESLYKTVNGTTSPTWDTMQRILKALNISVSLGVKQVSFG